MVRIFVGILGGAKVGIKDGVDGNNAGSIVEILVNIVIVDVERDGRYEG